MYGNNNLKKIYFSGLRLTKRQTNTTGYSMFTNSCYNNSLFKVTQTSINPLLQLILSNRFMNLGISEQQPL